MPLTSGRTGKNPDSVFILARRNCKVFRDLSDSPLHRKRVLYIFDTVVGSIFIQKDQRINNPGPIPKVRDATSRLLSIYGLVTISVHPSTSKEHVTFFVVEQVSEKLILSCVYVDKHMK